MDKVLSDTLHARLVAHFPPGYQALGRASSVEKGVDRVCVSVDDATVEVTALTPGLFRVGYFPGGRSINYSSPALAATDWHAGPVDVTGDDEHMVIATSSGSAHITLDPVRISFSDAAGRVFAADDDELGMGFCTPTEAVAIDVPNPLDTVGSPVRVYKRHATNESYFGCGERTGTLNKTGSHQLFWNIDPPAGHTALQNNLYVSIPFIVSLVNATAWGLFLDSMAATEFDLAREEVERSWFGAACGDLVYYICCGPSVQEVLAQYTSLTGRTPLPPSWSLGNGQSRYSYMSADELLGIARSFRERDIPCDTLYLDIDHMRGYRNFTWDRARFPDPEGLLTELQELGFHVVPLVDAGVKVDNEYAAYQQGHERGFFCQAIDGSEYQNVVWPGVCAFPDFFDARVRSWWGELHHDLINSGVAGIWCDMNEPALFVPQHSTMPTDVVHTWDGKKVMHMQVHNGYGLMMTQAVREGMLRLRPGQRPFVLSRSGYAGVQRSALVWTGDNSSTWDHLTMSIAQLLNLSLSGVAWCGTDIGGFYGDADGELLTRWIEMGIFEPFCRNHAEKQSRPQEPWAFGEPYTSICRTLLQLRQRLIPYLYTLFEECHRTGAPLLRPLFWEFPADSETYGIEDEFFCGGTLLIAPITRPGSRYRHVYLPEGDWFHFWTGAQVTGPSHVLVHAPLGQPAVYVRANHALPLGAPTQYMTSEQALTLLLFPVEGEATSIFYEDEGEGFRYEHGVYARRSVTCTMRDGRIHLHLGARAGNYMPHRQHLFIELRGLAQVPHTISSQVVSWWYAEESGTTCIKIVEKAEEQEIDVW